MRQPLEIVPLTAEEVEALDALYRSTKDVRVRTRVQIILLAGEQHMTAPAIAKIVRTDVSAGEIPSRFQGVLTQWLSQCSMLLKWYQGRYAFP